MRKKEYSILLEYLYNNELALEDEVKTAICNLRYRRVDVTDCFELAALLERYNTFVRVSNDLRTILKIFDKKSEK